MPNSKYDNVYKQVEQTLRIYGEYTVFKKSYYLTKKVLEDMKDKGLVTAHHRNNGDCIYCSTNKIITSYVVRDTKAYKIQKGFYIGIAKEKIAPINDRFYETPDESFEKIGVVTSVVTKDTHKNLWEMLTFKKSVKRTFLTIDGMKNKIVVKPDTVFQKVK